MRSKSSFFPLRYCETNNRQGTLSAINRPCLSGFHGIDKVGPGMPCCQRMELEKLPPLLSLVVVLGVEHWLVVICRCFWMLVSYSGSLSNVCRQSFVGQTSRIDSPPVIMWQNWEIAHIKMNTTESL